MLEKVLWTQRETDWKRHMAERWSDGLKVYKIRLKKSPQHKTIWVWECDRISMCSHSFLGIYLCKKVTVLDGLLAGNTAATPVAGKPTEGIVLWFPAVVPHYLQATLELCANSWGQSRASCWCSQKSLAEQRCWEVEEESCQNSGNWEAQTLCLWAKCKP